jgi:hypothetical protein
LNLLQMKPLGDAGLVGDDEHGIARVVEQLDRLFGAGNSLDLIKRVRSRKSPPPRT